MISGILILLIFLVAAGLMYTRRLPALLALPLMAVLIATVAGLSQPDWTPDSLRELIFGKVLTEGARRMAGAMVTTMFGAMLSQVVMRQGIAQHIIRWAAEYAGDRKLLMALILYGAVAYCFTSLSGLGPVIMVGSLVLPILVSSGFSPLYAATLMLLGIGVGGLFHPANWKFYIELLALQEGVVQTHALRVAAVMLAVSIFYLIFEGRRQSKSFAWAAPVAEEGDEAPRVPLMALLTPILPPLLMRFLHWPDIPAFILAILWGCLTTHPRRLIPNVTAAVLEGLKDVGPVLGLFIGLGMTLNATMDPASQSLMEPFLQRVLPSTAAGYVVFFTLLSPLTLYRGPFNLYGLGAGFAAMMAKSSLLPPTAVMAAFMSVGQVQSVCDPTNTHNVWIAQFVHESPDRILKHTLPYVAVFVLLALLLMVGVMKVMG